MFGQEWPHESTMRTTTTIPITKMAIMATWGETIMTAEFGLLRISGGTCFIAAEFGLLRMSGPTC
jgi:hypothetical protein